MNKIKGLLCTIVIALIVCVGCGSKRTVMPDELASLGVDFDNAEAFEIALNNGDELNGKVVQFCVTGVKPDSAFGFNLWAGEHLNFIFEDEIEVKEGSMVTAYCKDIKKKLGSWIIDSIFINSVDSDLNNDVEMYADIERSIPQDQEVVYGANIDLPVIEDDQEPQKPDTEDKPEEVSNHDNEDNSSTITNNEQKEKGDDASLSEETSQGVYVSESKEVIEKNEDVTVTEKVEEPTDIDIEETAPIVESEVVPSVDSLPEQTVSNNAVSSGGDGSNFDTYNIPEQQNTSDTWVLNTNSDKIHHPSCNSVKKIKPSNYATSNLSIEELLAQGYTRCGNCFK